VAKATVSDTDFITLFKNHGPEDTARRLGIGVRRVYERRVRIEQKIGAQLTGPEHQNSTRYNIAHPHRVCFDVKDGVVLIASDCHYWPGIVSTAHRAFVKFCREMKPKAVIMNGDVFDGASVSRHPPIGWESAPTVIEEIEACQERLGEIIDAAGKAKRIWTLGNHDSRFETRLATVAPQYARVHGVHLRDHFPQFEPAWSAWINGDVVVKHRNRGGIHATRNNTLNAGKTIVTGHLHQLKVTPLTDYNGTRWGVDTGTLADPGGPQFVDYLEDNVTDWRSGFVVLTFHKGRLLPPEIVPVSGENTVDFRGAVIRV
jgi:predicted phosphodiesterase